MSPALQAYRMGLVAHGMGGFDYGGARAKLNMPEDFAVMCMVALGRPGRREDLPEKKQAWEQPNERMLAEKFTFAGRMPGADEPPWKLTLAVRGMNGSRDTVIIS